MSNLFKYLFYTNFESEYCYAGYIIDVVLYHNKLCGVLYGASNHNIYNNDSYETYIGSIKYVYYDGEVLSKTHYDNGDIYASPYNKDVPLCDMEDSIMIIPGIDYPNKQYEFIDDTITYIYLYGNKEIAIILGKIESKGWNIVITVEEGYHSRKVCINTITKSYYVSKIYDDGDITNIYVSKGGTLASLGLV